MSSTYPSTPSITTSSPILNGLKIKIKSPPAKLDKLPCSARPIAIPAAPNIVINTDAL